MGCLSFWLIVKTFTCETYVLEQSAFVALSVNEGLIFPPKIARTDPGQWADVAADVGSRAAAIQAVSFFVEEERLAVSTTKEGEPGTDFGSAYIS